MDIFLARKIQIQSVILLQLNSYLKFIIAKVAIFIKFTASASVGCQKMTASPSSVALGSGK